MPTKIKAKGKVKTLSGKYTSFLSKDYKATYYRLDNEADMIQHIDEMQKSDIRHNKFESLDSAISDETEKVKTYLKKLSLPYDDNGDYEIVYDFQKNEILIDGEPKGATFHPLYEQKMKHYDLSGKGKGSTNLSGLLSEWYSHIPAAQSISQFFHCIREVKSYREKNDIDRCAAYAIRAISYTRHIVIAQMEDYEQSQSAKQMNSRERDRYLLDRWDQLKKEGVLKNSAGEIITKELNDQGHKISFSRVRKKLQGQNLDELRHKYNL